MVGLTSPDRDRRRGLLARAGRVIADELAFPLQIGSAVLHELSGPTLTQFMDIGLHSVKCGIAAALIDELVVCSGRGRRRARTPW
jgi:hypothetical protein